MVAGSTPLTSIADFIHVIDSLKSELPVASRSMSMQDLNLISSALHELLADVKSKMNNLTAIHKLPDELLYLIFNILLSVISREEYSGYWLHGPPKEVGTATLVCLTHVCRRWRHLLLDAPSVWAQIGSSGPEKLKTYLERSRTLPLSMVLTNDTHNVQDVLSQHGWRLQRLDLTVNRSCTTLDPLLSFSPPPSSLECLTVTTEGYVVDEGYPSTPLLFDQSSMNLRALALAPAHGWLPSNQFPSLTHLYLYEVRPSMRVPSVKLLLALLSRSPALQFVHISSVHPDPEDPVYELPMPAIALDRLRFLVLKECGLEFLDLLAEASLPAHMFMCISDLCNIRDPARLRLPRLPFLLEDVHELDIAVCDGVLQFVADGPSLGFWLDNEHRFIHTGSWTSWLSDILLATTSLSRLTTLRVSLDDGIDILSTAALPRMPQLLELGIRFDYQGRFRDATGRTRQWDPQAVGVARVLSASLGMPGICPHLRALHLEVNIRRRLHPGVHPDFADMCPPILVDVLATRAESVHPLRLLTIQPMVAKIFARGPTTRDSVAASIQSTFAQVKPFVEACVVHPSPSPELATVMFKMRDCWNMEGAEEYWDLDPDFDKPQYILPTDGIADIEE